MMTDQEKEERKISEEEKALWACVVEDIAKSETLVERGLRQSASRIVLENDLGQNPAGKKKSTSAISRQGTADIDHKTYERFKKGKMPIEARLDLHGLTQDNAHETLLPFIEQAYQYGKRMILIVTGKGTPKGKETSRAWYEPEPGILRRMLPVWLEKEPLGQYVLKYTQAQRKDGGDGAFYVLLKRKR